MYSINILNQANAHFTNAYPRVGFGKVHLNKIKAIHKFRFQLTNSKGINNITKYPENKRSVDMRMSMTLP